MKRFKRSHYQREAAEKARTAMFPLSLPIPDLYETLDALLVRVRNLAELWEILAKFLKNFRRDLDANRAVCRAIEQRIKVLQWEIRGWEIPDL